VQVERHEQAHAGDHEQRGRDRAHLHSAESHAVAALWEHDVAIGLRERRRPQRPRRRRDAAAKIAARRARADMREQPSAVELVQLAVELERGQLANVVTDVIRDGHCFYLYLTLNSASKLAPIH